MLDSIVFNSLTFRSVKNYSETVKLSSPVSMIGFRAFSDLTVPMGFLNYRFLFPLHVMLFPLALG